MHRLCIPIFTITVLSMALPAWAQTMEEAFAAALRSNSEVEEARANARRIHENVALAVSRLMPTLRLNGSGQYSRKEIPRLDLDSGQLIVGLSVSQVLFSSGQNGALIRQAMHEVQRSHANVEFAEQRILLNVAIAYLDAYRAERVLLLRQRSVKAFEKRSDQTKAQYRVGDRTQADVAQADAERRIAVADVASARFDLRTQKALFETLVGLPANDLGKPENPGSLPTTLAVALQLAKEVHPAVRAAGYAIRSAKQAILVESAKLGPRIVLEGSISRDAGYDRLSIGKKNVTDSTVGLQFTLPLYQGGSGGVGVRQARKALSLRRAEQTTAQNQALQQATAAWNELNAARQRERALTAAFEASRVALEAIVREAEIGERSTYEVLAAERQTTDIELALLAAQRNILAHSFRLKAAVGGLTARLLGIAGLPDLEREARKTSRNLMPGIFYLDSD